MPTLNSAGVSVYVTDTSVYATPSPTTIPLFVIATRANKSNPAGTGIAAGTSKSDILRIITSQTSLIQNYGLPVTVTSDGEPVLTDETNELTLNAAYSFLGIASMAYILRANIDLGQLVSNSVEPVLPAPNGTFWLNTSTATLGIFKFNGSTWAAQPGSVFTTTPGSGDGANGNWAFDYSTLDGTIRFKSGGNWYPATTTNLTTIAGTTNGLWVSSSAPGGAVSGDFWYRTTSSSGGVNLQITQYQASNGVWVTQSISHVTSAPTPTLNLLWEDDSNIASTGARPIYVGTGDSFIAVPLFVQSTAPTTAPAKGTLWFNDDITDFALYVQNGSDTWTPIVTEVVSNPTNTQKVISASAPIFPNTGAIWVDVSTPENLDNFPVVKQWSGSQWVDISSSVLIQSADPGPSLVADGTYWLNTGDLSTQNIVKIYNPDFTALTVVDGTTTAQTGNFWQPDTGSTFGRLSQRNMVVAALSQSISSNSSIRAETNYFQLIAVPGYPELYTDMVDLNTDNANISFVCFDTPKFMIPDGVPTGREITAQDWATNSQNVATTGEQGFSGAPSPYAACWYPWGLATDPATGLDILIPPTQMALNVIAYSDSVAYPWLPPAGINRGPVNNALSVGYVADNGTYTPVQLNRGERDILAENSINAISNVPSQGLTIMGQTTMSLDSTALNRINVARLIIKMQYDLQRLMEPFLFEINDAITRASVLIVVQRYLAGLQSLRALYDYAVQCDGSNNTGATIDAHDLYVGIAIQPAKSIEFIYVPIQIVNTGAAMPF